MSLTDGNIVTVRLPRTLSDEVREIAQRQFETQATVLRRLLKRGLEREHQQAQSDAQRSE